MVFYSLDTRVFALVIVLSIGDAFTAQFTQLCRELATATVQRQAVVVHVYKIIFRIR